MPYVETYKLCGFKDHLARPCMKEQECRKHKDLICCSCGNKATHVCDSMIGGNFCGEYLCNQCEHIGEIHKRKLQTIRRIQMEILFTVDNNTFRCGKLKEVVAAAIKNAIELHCEDAEVMTIKVE